MESGELYPPRPNTHQTEPAVSSLSATVHARVDSAIKPKVKKVKPRILRPIKCASKECGEALRLAQPDPEDPDRLIGQCPGCTRIYSVTISEGAPPALRRVYFAQRQGEPGNRRRVPMKAVAGK